MHQPEMDYRIWQRGSQWHWQVTSKGAVVLASGFEKSATAARKAAFSFCLDTEHNRPDPN